MTEHACKDKDLTTQNEEIIPLLFQILINTSNILKEIPTHGHCPTTCALWYKVSRSVDKGLLFDSAETHTSCSGCPAHKFTSIFGRKTRPAQHVPYPITN